MPGLTIPQKLEYISEHGDTVLTAWEESFIESVTKFYKKADFLTPKQEAVLDKIYAKVEKAASSDRPHGLGKDDDDISF